jgi:hypothetical protein
VSVGHFLELVDPSSNHTVRFELLADGALVIVIGSPKFTLRSRMSDSGVRELAAWLPRSVMSVIDEAVARDVRDDS